MGYRDLEHAQVCQAYPKCPLPQQWELCPRNSQEVDSPHVVSAHQKQMEYVFMDQKLAIYHLVMTI